MNYIGPNDGQGIRVYSNRLDVVSETTRVGGSYSTGDSRVVVGRISTDISENGYRYRSMQLDELVFFNKALSTTEITAMYNAV